MLGLASGIIRVIRPTDFKQERKFIGHGQAVNELRFALSDPALLLSASADHAIRLWNVDTDCCVLIFGGERGHRDEVLSVDFNFDATKVVSCGMDHSLKVWSLETEQVRDHISRSHAHRAGQVGKGAFFKPYTVHGPIFSTCAVHRNYVDCMRWLGNLILSKSTDNKIVCWKPGGDPHICANETAKADMHLRTIPLSLPGRTLVLTSRGRSSRLALEVRKDCAKLGASR